MSTYPPMHNKYAKMISITLFLAAPIGAGVSPGDPKGIIVSTVTARVALYVNTNKIVLDSGLQHALRGGSRSLYDDDELHYA
jgi:hypothetical protein